MPVRAATASADIALVQEPGEDSIHRLTELNDVAVRVVDVEDPLPPRLFAQRLDELDPGLGETDGQSVEIRRLEVELEVLSPQAVRPVWGMTVDHLGCMVDLPKREAGL